MIGFETWCRSACFIAACLVAVGCSSLNEQTSLKTAFELSDSLETSTYDEGIAWWKQLEEASPYVCLQTFGQTDVGKPLHLVIINPSRNFSREKIVAKEKTILLINNAIHPGEPDGVDASMLFARSLVSREDFTTVFEDVIILIIPFYNVGGALNRNCCSRANQNGPVSYGFRGNARNLDLNRDFSKADSKNAQSFIQMFKSWNPDVYLETHVSNGADYPYTMTFLSSHPDKLTPPMNASINTLFAEPLFERMEADGDAMIPYVNVFNQAPEQGFTCFYDSPKYSTGFTALHHTFGMLTETHMLKPYKQRVESTLRFMHHLSEIIAEQTEEIESSRQQALQTSYEMRTFPLDWEVDTSRLTMLPFKGYRSYEDTSDVTGLSQLHYDQSQTWEKDIPYHANLKPKKSVLAPSAYLIPLAWHEVIDRLRWNGVTMSTLDQDTAIEATVYRIVDFQTNDLPREGHYFHYQTQVEPTSRSIRIRANEYALIDLNQPAKRLIIEMLEPEGPDSYFNWNFFDEVLQQKEWFSTYVFEPEAREMLKDPALKEKYEAYLRSHPGIHDDAYAKLYYIYQQSSHFESDRFMIYPVFRLEGTP